MSNRLDLLRREINNLRNYWQAHLKAFLTSVIILFFLPSNLTGQISSADEYQLKAAFIYNFTRFVNWPPSGANRAEATFVISVLNDDRLAEKIRELVKGEQVGNHPILVRNLSNRSEIGNCHILYVSGREASDIKNQLPFISQRGILTVSDAPNFARWGGIIRFFKDDNRLRMQINIDEARKSRFGISSKLLNVSNIYSSN